ncbi:MAG: helix-turn-helix domain-containing protein [Alphaproteobacteria bacterium]|nr:helix-turn-helix domain-containing protein [Alphaproteobacteria bacterium]
MPDPATCERARLARDRRFDGRFFIAVRTTRIYCRPICPVRPARPENVHFFPSAAAAASAGYRPCLRCRPEAAPGSPAWRGSAASVSRGLALINRGFLDEHSVDALADTLGLGSRHLTRLFVRHVGATPAALAATRRIHLAKTLIDQTGLAMTEIAFAAGFGSIRRFNTVFRSVYGRSPSTLRRRPPPATATEGTTLRLAYRPPYRWATMAAFLQAEAIPGVEVVDAAGYRRTIRVGVHAGRLAVRPLADDGGLLLTLSLPDHGALTVVVERVRTMFDLSVDPATVREHLLRHLPRAAATDLDGLRLPGAWDGFEAAAHAVLARHLGHAAASAALGRIAVALGTRLADGIAPDRLFPTAEGLADAGPAATGLPAAPAADLRRLAAATAVGRIRFDPAVGHAALAAALAEAGGLDATAASWVAMRTLGEPDVDPRTLFPTPPRGARTLLAQAAALRPWGSYAALALGTAPTRSEAA